MLAYHHLVFDLYLSQVDSLFRTNVPGVFAIGDVAAFPLKVLTFISLHAREDNKIVMKFFFLDV